MAEPTPTQPEPPAMIPPSTITPPPDAPKTAASQTAADATKPDPTKPAAAGRADEKDPMRDLLDRLARMQPLLAGSDRQLSQVIETVVQQGADPATRVQPGFRHQVAYALQDLEKSPIGRLELNPDIRAEMTRLAGSAAGLENERMQAVMRTTASIDDRALIERIRAAGTQIARRVDQTAPEIESQIDSLENRVRLASRPIETVSTQPVKDQAERAAAGASERSNGQARAETQSEPDPQSSRPTMVQVAGRPILDTIMSALRPPDRGMGGPFDPPPTPMGDRIAKHATMMQDRADDLKIGATENSGRAAMEALKGFSAGEGAIVMNRIRDAARSEPGGMPAVLSEMRDGGKFSELRQQFNTALSDDRGVTNAFDKAASALARYGQDRPAIEQIIARRPDAANLTAKFNQMDAEIGEAAGTTPSRRDGKTMIDDLAKQAAELLQRAVDGIRSLFSRTASAGASPSPSPQ